MQIYTAGYQSITPVELADLAEAIGADRIIDVRSVPQSRKPGFSSKALSARFGTKYIWKGNILGGKAKIEDGAIRWLKSLSGVSLLLCMEQMPCDCHRYYEIGLRLRDMGVETLHFHDNRWLTTTQMKEICDEPDRRK